MINHWKNQIKAIIFILSLLSTGTMSASKLINNQHAQPTISIPSREQEIPIPADGQCLYKSIMVGYLLPVINDPPLFQYRLGMLLGEDKIITTEEAEDDQIDENKDDSKDDMKIDLDEMWNAKEIQKIFLNLRLSNLVTSLRLYPFPKLVGAMKKHMGIHHDLWGGHKEIQTIANHLQATIQEYTPDLQDHNKSLAKLNLTQPQHKKPLLTLRIVKDNPTTEEAVDNTQDWQMQLIQERSAIEAQHRHHYRALLDKTVIYHVKQDTFDQTNINLNNNVIHYLPNPFNQEQHNPSPSYIAPVITLRKNLRQLRWSPSPYECAVLSEYTYLAKKSINIGGTVRIEKSVPKKGIAKQKTQTHHLPKWKVVHLFTFDKFPQYQGILYRHSHKSQLVLAHQGTQGMADWIWTNLPGVVMNQIKGQTNIVNDILYVMMKQYAQEKDSIIITGHSLGGWLAQISLLLLTHKYPNRRSKAITFDTPGAKPMLEKLDFKYKKIVKGLDITNYFSSPNLVNCCNEHVGSLYRIVFKSFDIKSRWKYLLQGKIKETLLPYTLASHDLYNFIEAFDTDQGHAIQCHTIGNWPTLSLSFTELVKKIGKYVFTFISYRYSLPTFLVKPIQHLLNKMDGQPLLEYQGFFKFAHKINAYHIETKALKPCDEFDMVYKYKYTTTPHNRQVLHQRHLSLPVRQLIEAAIAKSTYHLNAILQAKLGYICKELSQDSSEYYIKTKSQKDMRILYDALESLVVQDPKLAQPASLEDLANDHPTQPTIIQQYIIQPKPLQIDGKNNMGLPHGQNYLQERRLLPRKEKVNAIKKQFGTLAMQEKSAVVCLVADGGMGKTILSELYAHATYKKPYKHIWCIHMEKVTACNNSIAQITYKLGIKNKNPNPSDLERIIYLQETLEQYPGWLLILDNVEKDAQGIKEFLKIKGGHILITTRHQLNLDAFSKSVSYLPWYKNQGNNTLLLNENDGLALLTHFHKPNGSHERTCATSIVKETKGLPLALATVGYYVENNQSGTIYSEYLNQLENSNIQDPLKQIFYITKEKLAKVPDTLRILRVMAYFNADGVDILFFKYLRPSRKEYIFKSFVKDQDKTIDLREAKKAWKLLRDYGMVGRESNTFKTHRRLQTVIRKDITQNKIAYYIQDQSVQLLETLHRKSKTSIKVTIRLNMLSHIRSVMGYIGKDVAYRCRLLYLLSHIEHTDVLEKNLYLPPQAKNGKDVHTQVGAFVRERFFGVKKPLMLITGDAGAGKSAYAAYLLQKTWEHYLASYSLNWGLISYKYIPLFISLPQLCTDQKLTHLNGTIDLVAKALADKGLTKEAIKSLRTKVEKQQEHLLLILDSLDEISPSINASTKNVYQKYQLGKWVNASTKVVITCRSAYLQGKDKRQLFPCDRVRHGKNKVEIAPFNRWQINSYIQKFTRSSYNTAGWKKKEYHDELAKFPSLKDMMERPFMLVIGLRILPAISKENPQTVTLHTLYEAFTQQWLCREKEKDKNRNVKGIENKIRTFCEELAFEMFQQGKYCIEKENKKLAHFLQRADTFQSAPLRQVSQGKYEFIQSSYRNFFAMQYIIKHPTEKRQISQKMLNHELVIFLTKGLYKHGKYQLIKQCWQKINQAREEKNRGIEAAYYLQLLYHMNPKSLQHQDLSGIDLQGGNLFGLDLTATSLKQANLKNAELPQNLSKCNLTGASLSGQNLTKVKLPKDLSKCNLTGAQLPKDLSKCNLTGASLSGQNLTKVKLPKDLSKCNLTGAQLPKDLSKCNLTGANLSGQNLTKIKLPKDLSKCNLTGAQPPKDLSKCNLTGANLSGQNLTKVKLPKDLSKCNLTGAQPPKDLSECNLTGANLSGQNLTKIKLPKDLSKCNLTGAQLPKDLSKCNLTDANLSGQNLTKVKLPKDLSYCNLMGAQLPKDLSKCNLTGANLSGQNLTKIKLPKDLSKCNLTGAQLPKDLSGSNLHSANLTGYAFTYTNLTDTNLTNVTLINTTCNYQKAFLDNIKNNQCSGGDWYQNNLPKDLRSIAKVYPKLNNDTHKVKLLQIACGFSRLPFYERTEFYIKLQYLSSELWILQQKLGNPYGQQLVCSLQKDLTYDANNYCWATRYQNKVTINAKAPHANFAQYLKDFTNGLTEYQCKSKDSWGFNWYKKQITKNIQGLKATYPKIKDQQLQQEACHIAHALSKSYQIQKGAFQNHYLFFQNRLIRLKNSVRAGVKNGIHYTFKKLHLPFKVTTGANDIHYRSIFERKLNQKSWSRGKK